MQSCGNGFYSFCPFLGMKYEEKLIEIGQRIQELRKAKGYTSYEDFALKNDMHRMTMFRAEAGKSLSLRILFKIIEGLEITWEEFFDGIK